MTQHEIHKLNNAHKASTIKNEKDSDPTGHVLDQFIKADRKYQNKCILIVKEHTEDNDSLTQEKIWQEQYKVNQELDQIYKEQNKEKQKQDQMQKKSTKKNAKEKQK
jgi:hypothetical protein